MTETSPSRGRAVNLSAKEHETLQLLAEGLNPQEIAVTLKVTTNYVYQIIRLLKARLDARTTAGMVGQAIREGLVQPQDTQWQESE